MLKIINDTNNRGIVLHNDTIMTINIMDKININDIGINIINGKIIVNDLDVNIMDKIVVNDTEVNIMNGKILINDIDVNIMNKIAVNDAEVNIMNKIYVNDTNV